ncbi:MAG: hypothetical protein IH977_05555 [Nitrospinae bacterium]|nr:hypothetical protein [Nitrospinota bacterium]
MESLYWLASLKSASGLRGLRGFWMGVVKDSPDQLVTVIGVSKRRFLLAAKG